MARHQFEKACSGLCIALLVSACFGRGRARYSADTGEPDTSTVTDAMVGSDTVVDAPQPVADDGEVVVDADDALSEDTGPDDIDVGVPNGSVFESAGGGNLSSPNYRLRLHVAPARPLADLSSPNYHLRLILPGGTP